MIVERLEYAVHQNGYKAQTILKCIDAQPCQARRYSPYHTTPAPQGRSLKNDSCKLSIAHHR